MATLAPDTPPDRALRQIVAECHADLLKYRADRAGEPPADRHPPDPGGAAPPARRAQPVPRRRRPDRGPPGAGDGGRGQVAGRRMRAGARPARFPDRDGRGRAAAGEAHRRAACQGASRARPHRPVRRALQRLRRPAHRLRRGGAAGPADGRLDEFGRACSSGATPRSSSAAGTCRSLDGKDLHRLRIAIKKLRYAATFLRPAFASPREAKAYIEATVRLQGALGALNDRAVAARCWTTSPWRPARRKT